MDNIYELRRFFERNRQEMEEFVRKCRAKGRSRDSKELFKLLCCSLLASQAKWEDAEGAVEYLEREKRLFDGDYVSIQDGLRYCKYRSPNNKQKAKWIYDARQCLYDDGCEVGIVDFVHMLGILSHNDPIGTRNLLADLSRDNHISGLGMKEASHFLRDLGFSHNQLAILDRVILAQLEKFGLLEKRPENLPKKTYLSIENQVKDWADHIVGIPLDVLDLLLWKMGRGKAQSR